MTRSGQVALGVLVAAGVVGMVMASGKKASAATPPVSPPLLPPLPGNLPIPPSGGVVMVPPDGGDHPDPGVPPVVAPPTNGPIALPGGGSFDPTTGQATTPGGTVIPVTPPSAPAGTTYTIPGVGTYDPATGNVFGPQGVIVGTYNPKTGMFTPAASSAPVPTTPAQLPPIVMPSAPLPDPLGGLTQIPNPTVVLSPPAPAAGNPEATTSAPADTIATVTAMLAQEASPSWRKMPEPTLVTWQKNRGLGSDGKFGTGSALAMAKEIGTLPIIRAWPSGSYKEGAWLGNYQSSLRTLAASAPEPRKSQLMAAAEREQGQGWGTPETPIVSQIHLAGV